MTTLKQLVKRDGPLDIGTAVRHVEEIARELAAVHLVHPVHGGVSPENVTLDARGKACLGSPFEQHEVAAIEETAAFQACQGGQVDCLAPEQALNSARPDARSDIYSLGCILYYLLAGRPPFASGTIAEKLVQHQLATPESVRQLRPDAPAALVRLCEKMLAKRPAERCQTADEVLRTIATWRGN